MADTTPPPAPTPSVPKRGKKVAQEIVADFWDKFNTKKPGKVTSIFPRSLYKSTLPPAHPDGARSARNATDSYEAAAKECRERVEQIKQECQRTNEKFTDPDFDVESDPENNCLNGLVRDEGDATGGTPETGPVVSAWDFKNSLETLAQSQVLGESGKVPVDANALSKILGGGDNYYSSAVSSGENYYPGAVHRVDWIFEDPRFTVNGYSSSDIKQGSNGDCWWLAAVATIAHRKDLMDKVCVAKDEECGVYGFVFQRDGEWISTVIDDNLYLRAKDFDYYGDVYDATGKKGKKHRKTKQTGSEALYFAHCDDPNETWLPLLEKAYAKAHGDYEAISGGWSGEAVEDMTGGVTTTLASNRVLSKDKLWKELKNSEGEFVFALSAMGTGWDWKKGGLALGHAYSVLQAREEVDDNGNRVRLVQIRNPWGERAENGVGEWNGPWSDGSKEWTAYWLKKFDHTFGDDGVFWMSYKDMLETFMFIHRTRLFDDKWTVVQQWTSTNISWLTGYLQIKFEVEVKKAGPLIVVLTQLDDRYFKGFEGEYYFELHFLLRRVGAPITEHLCRVRPVHKWENRSVSCEVTLEPGQYEVLPKVVATRQSGTKPVEDVVEQYAKKNPQKLRQVGMQYDLAHSKGGILNEDEALEKKRLDDEKKKQEKKRKRRAKAKKQKAMGKAADAMASAADAMKELAKPEADTKKSKNGDKEENSDEKQADPKNDSKAKVVTTELEGEGAKSVEGQKPVTTAKPYTAGAGPSPDKSDKLKKPEAENENDKEKKQDEDKGIEVEKKDEEKDSKEDKKDEDENEDSEAESESESDDDKDNDQPTDPWNAVAVIGLRVYACDPDISITLREPSNAEDGAALTIEGQTAGATI